MIAYCGLDCSQCSIYQAAQNPEKAESLAAAWKKAGHANACPEWFCCQGCLGPDELLWSGDCKIRACCRGKGLDNCSTCCDFPCGRLLEFASGDESHRQAVDALRSMRNSSGIDK